MRINPCIYWNIKDSFLVIKLSIVKKLIGPLDNLWLYCIRDPMLPLPKSYEFRIKPAILCNKTQILITQ